MNDTNKQVNFGQSFRVHTVEIGGTGLTKSSKSTFPRYAILARVRPVGSYAGQLGAGDTFTGFLAKFANAV